MDLVSICVAAGDRVDLLLTRCLPSVLAQTYANIEVCIVGDCIAPEAEARIRALGDARIRFSNLLERGPYPPPGSHRWMVAGTNAMNAAMRMARGRYLTHLDDDDAMTPDKVERCCQHLSSNGYDFVHHKFAAQGEDGLWKLLGDGSFRLGQITTGAVFYRRELADVEWDVSAYKRALPGDWDRFERMRDRLKPRIGFLDMQLLWHFRENNYREFVPKPGERFLDA